MVHHAYHRLLWHMLYELYFLSLPPLNKHTRIFHSRSLALARSRSRSLSLALSLSRARALSLFLSLSLALSLSLSLSRSLALSHSRARARSLSVAKRTRLRTGGRGSVCCQHALSWGLLQHTLISSGPASYEHFVLLIDGMPSACTHMYISTCIRTCARVFLLVCKIRTCARVLYVLMCKPSVGTIRGKRRPKYV